MKSFYALLFFALISFNSIAQAVNEYKYVIVPDRYSWAGAADKYQVNSLTTFLFKKYGFEAYQLGEILPSDMNAGACNALTADVTEDSSILRTKLKVILKNCKGEIVFISDEGTSKEKEYKKAYHEALRSAFLSIKELEYTYVGSSKSVKEESNNLSTPSTTSVDVQKDESVQEVAKVLEAPKVPEVVTTTQKVTTVDRYISQDGTYRLEVSKESLVFYEGSKVIGMLVPKASSSYPVKTSEFNGKGYFVNEQFIVEREIKGVQGVIQMIFEKE